MKTYKNSYITPESEVLFVAIENNILSGEIKQSSFSDDKAEVVDRSNENWW